MSSFDEIAMPGEEQAIATLVALVIAKQEREHKLGETALRAFHPKSHGSYRATFQVRANIPAPLKVGVFSEPKAYQALVRFSNGGGKPDTFDAFPNVRGMAVKLFDVQGKKLLPGEEDSGELDFILSNDKPFFFWELAQMILVFQGKVKELVKQDPHVVWRILKAVVKLVKNPLFTEYYSQAAYAIGDHVCKYALIPSNVPAHVPLPNFFDRHYMRHSIEKVLASDTAAFTFGVQLRRQDSGAGPAESIEDPTQVWTGEIIPVADLVFQRMPALPDSQDEGLSFNPWRVLPEHQPLGWVGRARKLMYAAGFKWRSGLNKKQLTPEVGLKIGLNSGDLAPPAVRVGDTGGVRSELCDSSFASGYADPHDPFSGLRN